MQIFPGKTICVSTDFYLLVATFLLVLPFNWVVSWLAASLIHELSHIIVLTFFGVNIHALKISASGAMIETDPMELHKELLASIAGPIGGLCTLFFMRHIPHISICALVQSAYNLLPIHQFDGGRTLRCFLRLFWDDCVADTICKFTTYSVLFALFILAFFLYIRYNMGILPIAIPIFLYFKFRK